jgi:hypothetical protein
MFAYSITQEVYCLQVAPQQCLFPLQLPDYKDNIFFDNVKLLNNTQKIWITT